MDNNDSKTSPAGLKPPTPLNGQSANDDLKNQVASTTPKNPRRKPINGAEDKNQNIKTILNVFFTGLSKLLNSFFQAKNKHDESVNKKFEQIIELLGHDKGILRRN